jgi:putative transport protein
MLLTFIIATKLFKMNILESLGGICGGMTSTPALGAISAKVDSEVPVTSYATAYPVALILMTIATQILISMLGA